MAKEITFVRIIFTCDNENHETLSKAGVYYEVSDDTDPELTKHDSYNVDSPDFTGGVDAFWSAEIAAIKTREGIS